MLHKFAFLTNTAYAERINFCSHATHSNVHMELRILTALTKSTNMDIWVVGTSNQLFIKSILKLKQNLQKNKVVTSKTPFFVTGPFCALHSICLDIGF